MMKYCSQVEDRINFYDIVPYLGQLATRNHMDITYYIILVLSTRYLAIFNIPLKKISPGICPCKQ